MRFTKFHALAAASLLSLSGCGSSGNDEQEAPDDAASVTADSAAKDYGYDTYSDDNHADSMASNDSAYTDGAAAANPIPDPQERPIMQAQVVLDRIGFGPGVIDGKMGMSTENAVRGFQEAGDLQTTGKLDQQTKAALEQWDNIPATRIVTIPANWGSASYPEIPASVAGKAEMDRLGYESLDERLAERFHTTVEVLKELNPGGRPAGMTEEGNAKPATAAGSSSPTPTMAADEANARGEAPFFSPGQQVRVPNIGADRIAPASVAEREWQRTLASLGVGTEQPEVDRIVVSKAGKTLKAYRGDELVALFTVSSGSAQFPLPLGEWKILGEAHLPPFAYDPEVLGKGDGKEHKLPPGPNSPVGVVWIDLSKEHYGIHGTPEPETIGRAQSSGCVRLTNWDAARLSQMVSQQTEVLFEA